MAANNNNSGTGGRRNFYSVSYGKLSTKSKEIPENYSEVFESDLKAKTEKVEQIDLRNKYMNKGTGEYPYVVYYDSITGVITAQEKSEYDKGTSFNLTIQDTDGDTSVIQMKFYSKYTENILNRLINAPQGAELTFFPYSIPNTAEMPDGKKLNFYTQGVSLKANGTKIEPKYKNDDAELPATEQVKVQGKTTTSRDARLDFLYNKFSEMFTPSEAAPKTESNTPVNGIKEAATQVEPAKSLTHDDLPFG